VHCDEVNATLLNGSLYHRRLKGSATRLANEPDVKPQSSHGNLIQKRHLRQFMHHFVIAVWRAKRQNAPNVKEYAATLAILALLSATLALSEDFKTVGGKLYKDATIIRVESNGIVLKTKTGISKIYFVELPNDVQERFHPTPAKTAATQRQREPIKLEGWAAVMANRTAVVMFFVAGTIIIAGVVFAIVRRRFQ
jgi:hypothetical protein